MEKPDFLQNLNPEQLAAATHGDGPLLIVAGAGTGKTTVLINRLAYLILEKKVNPQNILLLTFTDKTAAEMTERADKALPYGYVDLRINTFHSFGEHLLREHGLDIGLPADFKLITQTEQWILIRKNLDRFNLDYYRPLGDPAKFIQELIKHFSRLKDENIEAADYLTYAEELEADDDNKLSGTKEKGKGERGKVKGEKLSHAQISELADAFHVYNQLLLEKKFLDFGDLINYTIKLFRERPHILEHYREQFKYIMVDEFQDTNWSQYELVKMLSAPKNNLVAVGDDDQSIYKFRGASIANIMQFKDDYPQATEIVLTKNYRSGQKILDHAYQFIINNNPNRLETKLNIDKKIIAPNNSGGLIQHLAFATEHEETQGVALLIKNIKTNDNQATWSDFAVLTRTNDAATKFTKELDRQNLPNQFVSLRGLYYKPIIMDTLAWLRLLDNYHESTALYRVLNMPLFAINHLDIVNLNRFAQKKLWSLYETLKNIQAVPDLDPQSVVHANKLLNLIQEHTTLARDNRPSQVFVRFVYDCLLPFLDKDRDREPFAWLNQFYKKIIAFEENNPEAKLRDFVEQLNWELEAGDSGSLSPSLEDFDTIKVMTAHNSKGLEFKYVFLVNLVDKKFPTINRSDQIPLPDALVKEKLPDGDVHLEEERRLFYVGMTRAKAELYLTSALDYGGARAKKPSRFISEAGLSDNVEPTKINPDNELQRDLDSLPLTPNPSTLTPFPFSLPSALSYSQLNSYANCPYQYQFNYVLKIPTPDKPTAIFGRLIHNVLREFLTPLLTDSLGQSALFTPEKKIINLTAENLQKIYKSRWSDFGYDNQAQAAGYRAQGQKFLLGFFQQLNPESLPQILFLEKSFTLKLGHYQLRGAIDRVDQLADGTVEIIDYKTGKAKEKLTFDEKKQLLIYQLALEQALNLKISRLTFYYLEDQSQQSFVAKPDELTKVQDWVLATINDLKTGNFPPKPGILCRYCDYNSLCEFRQA